MYRVRPCRCSDPSHQLKSSHVEKPDTLLVPRQQIDDFVDQEFNVRRLDEISSLFWIAGRPMPPRPLHRQLMMGRDVVLCEQLDMHLVWVEGQILLKPLPRFLLSRDFWVDNLLCLHDCECVRKTTQLTTARRCARSKVFGAALGLVYSYLGLICYESDFSIAKEKGLLPEILTWQAWRDYSESVYDNLNLSAMNPRFRYGKVWGGSSSC